MKKEQEYLTLYVIYKTDNVSRHLFDADIKALGHITGGGKDFRNNEFDISLIIPKARLHQVKEQIEQIARKHNVTIVRYTCFDTNTAETEKIPCPQIPTKTVTTFQVPINTENQIQTIDRHLKTKKYGYIEGSDCFFPPKDTDLQLEFYIYIDTDFKEHFAEFLKENGFKFKTLGNHKITETDFKHIQTLRSDFGKIKEQKKEPCKTVHFIFDAGKTEGLFYLIPTIVLFPQRLECQSRQYMCKTFSLQISLTFLIFDITAGIEFPLVCISNFLNLKQ